MFSSTRRSFLTFDIFEFYFISQKYCLILIFTTYCFGKLNSVLNQSFQTSIIPCLQNLFSYFISKKIEIHKNETCYVCNTILNFDSNLNYF